MTSEGKRAKVGYVGEDREGRRVYQFSQSWLGTSGMCLEQARLSMTGELPPSDNDATIRGTGVHAGIEYLLHEKKAGNALDYSVAREVCERSVRQDLESMPHLQWTKYDGPQDLAKLLHHCDVMLATWLEQVEPKVNPHLIEHEFRVPLIETEYVVYLTGTMDCVTTDGVIWDWKTSDSAYTTRDTWKHQRYGIQPTVYAYAMNHELAEFAGDGEQLFKFCCLRPNGKHDILPVRRVFGDYEWLRHQVNQLVDLVDATPEYLDHWPLGPTDWWCSPKWCPAWDDCRGKYVEEGWDKTIKV